MPSQSYENRRGELLTYFDQTAADKWEQLTSDAPVSGIRATVRAGRDTMRQIIANNLPDDLTGARILDAGCGTGLLADDLAKRGATVVAIDLSPKMIEIARRRHNGCACSGTIEFKAGDMLAEDAGVFDHIVAMDSFIHYDAGDLVVILEQLAKRTKRSLTFTIAPKTPALTVMHQVGRLFPKDDRAPAIQPHVPSRLVRLLSVRDGLENWRVKQLERVKSGFYISEAISIKKSVQN